MRKAFALLLISIIFLSCKKESIIVPLRCGTVYHQPSWAKNFSSDSLSDISNFVFVMYRSQLPSSQSLDTSYNILVPVKFMGNGTGIINNNSSFTYSIVLTESSPYVHISGLTDMSSVFPFSHTFLSQPVIKFRVESYLKTGGQFHFTNGVQYPLTSLKYESSYLAFKRN